MSKSFEQFQSELVEAGLSRIWQKTQSHTSGAITGYRGDDSKAENKRKNKEILAFLRKKGYSVTKVLGTYTENKGDASERVVKEPSFFVVNDSVEGDDKGVLERDLRKLGARYDQDSILVVPHGGKGAYLVGTSKRDDAWPDFGQKVTVGQGKFGKVAGEFISKIKGRQFAFEAVEYPQTINGIRGQKLLAQEVEEALEGVEIE